MADFSGDFCIEYGDGWCRINFRCFDTPNAVTIYDSGPSVGLLGPDPSVGPLSRAAASRQPPQAACQTRADADGHWHAENLLIQVRRLCLELHRLWSFSLAGSDLHRINQAQCEVEVDPRTARLIQTMKDLHQTEPKFDFTVGPLSFFWKRAQGVPPQGQIDEALALVGVENVQVSGTLVRKAHPGVQVDIGAVAKGYVADMIACMLREQGVTCADIDLGGNIYMVGRHPSGRPWRVSVLIPEGLDVEPIIVDVADESVVTSGVYERFVEIDGKRYQHIIDPQTGWPADSDFVSATVIAKSSCVADALATVLLMTGSAGFDAFARRHPDCRLIAITTDGRVLSAPGRAAGYAGSGCAAR